MNDTIMVSNIQRMCFHDGPGIRTTVFLKGCSIHCPWCSNPENISFYKEQYSVNGVCGVYGKEYSGEELISVIKKDEMFFGKDGGVTFSGGEPLMQTEALEGVFAALKKEGINIAVESSMFIPAECLRIAHILISSRHSLKRQRRERCIRKITVCTDKNTLGRLKRTRVKNYS